MKTIIANPPFSVNWDANIELLKDPRFSEYEKLAPKSKADFAFIQDMVYQLDFDGIMSVVLPHGVLFRGSSEGVIRRFLIEKMNVLDAVIGLPENLFFGTTIPTCILVFRKNRSANEPIIFIDASKEFDKLKNKNSISEVHIDKIVYTYRNKVAIDKYSYLASLKDVSENDYNLNIPRYVDTFEEEEQVDIYTTMSEINRLKKESSEIEKQLNVYLSELGLPLFDIDTPVKKVSRSKDQFNNQITLF